MGTVAFIPKKILAAAADPVARNLTFLQSEELERTRIHINTTRGYVLPSGTPSRAHWVSADVYESPDGMLYIASHPRNGHDKTVFLFWDEKGYLFQSIAIDALLMPHEIVSKRSHHPHVQKALDRYRDLLRRSGVPAPRDISIPSPVFRPPAVQKTNFGGYRVWPYEPPRAPSPPRVQPAPSAPSPPQRPLQQPPSPARPAAPPVSPLQMTSQLMGSAPSPSKPAAPPPTVVRPAATPSPAARGEITQRLVAPYSKHSVGDRESHRILAETEIHGSPFNGASLTRHILDKEGLNPHYKIEVDTGDEIFFSLPYLIEDERIAVVAYVLNSHRERVARTYYLSHSQVVWRYLPQYVAVNGKLVWYSKGHSEDSIMAPIAMQMVLADISSASQPRISKFGVDSNLIFAGTTWASGQQPTYKLEVDALPELLPPHFYSPNGKVPPEKLAFYERSKGPDFSRPIASWRQETPHYGTFAQEAFLSFDGTQKFIFCREVAPKRGAIIRAGVGGLENNSPITSTGLRKRWIRGGDLVTGFREYFIPEENVDQTGGYGDPDWREGPYVDMFQRYTSQIPMVQEYLRIALP